jgi:uncharacterized protein with GYD domain
MFLSTDNKRSRAIAAGIDLAVDFATLGEYRVVVEQSAPRTDADLWAADVEWTAPTRDRSTTCSLPRAHDRAVARELVRG